MSSYASIYMNNPTAGGTDGTAVSEEHAMTAPISATLTVTTTAGAEAAVKCAIRCNTGYQTLGNTVLSLYSYDSTTKTYSAGGGTTGKFRLAADNAYTSPSAALAGAAWSDTLTISSTVGGTNTIFWVRMTADAGDAPIKDSSVAIHHEELIEPV